MYKDFQEYLIKELASIYEAGLAKEEYNSIAPRGQYASPMAKNY